MFTGHVEHAGGDEARRSGVHVDTAMAPMVTGLVVQRIDPSEYTSANRWPIDRVKGCMDAQVLRVADGAGCVSGDDEHLRRDAPPV